MIKFSENPSGFTGLDHITNQVHNPVNFFLTFCLFLKYQLEYGLREEALNAVNLPSYPYIFNEVISKLLRPAYFVVKEQTLHTSLSINFCNPIEC